MLIKKYDVEPDMPRNKPVFDVEKLGYGIQNS